MKPLFIAIALLLTAPALAFDNEPSGFRGIEWDTPLEQVAEQFSLLTQQKGGVNFYQRKDEKMVIGDADLASVTYIFYKGRFQGAMIRTADGAGNKRAIRDALNAQFGAGNQPNRYIERFYWFGAVATISLDCFGSKPYCMAFIRSKAVSDLERADKKTAADAAKKDF